MVETDQRQFPRIPAENVALVTKREGEEIDSFVKARSVGLGGFGFIAEQSLGVGAVIELMISVRPRVVKAEAQVRYENEREDGRVEIGVEFIRLDEQDEVVIRDLLASLDQPATDEESS